MPVIYSIMEKQMSLEKEPYKALTKQFKSIKNNIDGQIIELKISSEKEGFFRGFYTDHEYTNQAAIRFLFSNPHQNKSHSFPTFIRMEFSFECNDINYHFYQRHINLLKKRVPYFYIPFVSCFEFSHCIDDKFRLMFDISVDDKEKVLDSCYCLLSLIIAIFSFED